MEVKKFQVRALRHQRPVTIKSIRVKLTAAVGSSRSRYLTVEITPVPPKWAVTSEINDDMLEVTFHCNGTMGQYILYPGLRLVRGLDLKNLEEHKCEWT